LVVVDGPSIDEALRRIGELGGETVLGKRPVGDMGFSAYARDTEGNVIGLWEEKGPPAPHHSQARGGSLQEGR
jgi:predicted enzyme related to lactoylglutathione lyase